MADITSANAVLILTVPLLLPVPQQIQGFSADDIFDVADVDAKEIMMGVDGTLNGGIIFAPKEMNIRLMASSPSVTFFDAWYYGEQAAVSVFPATGTITLTSVGKAYAMTTGMLSRYKPVADARKVLQPQTFRITWQSMQPIPVGPAG